MDTVHEDGMRLGALAVAVLAALLIVAPAADGAATRDGWGFAVADDDWEWSDPTHPLPSLGDGFADLAPKAFRFQMIWNAADFSWHMHRARSIVARARAQGVEQIVVTFKRSVEPDLDPEGLRPSAESYGEHVDAVVRQLADDVDVWGPANEPNRGEMWLPGVEGAQLLARYHAELEQAVATWDPSAETTSPDFVDRADLGTIERYVRPYVNAGGGWGDHVAFHPYWGAHSETTRTTLDLIGLAPPGADVWITEVGAFARDQGAIEATETTQNDKVWWLATTLAALPQVERIHYYHMRGNPNASWDTGLMEVDATPRIAWHTWCAMARGSTHPACQPVTPPTPAPPAPAAPTATAASTPPAPPAAGIPPPAAPETVLAEDRTAPRVSIRRLARKLTYGEFVDGIALRLRASEPSAVEVDVVVEARRRGDRRERRLVVASKALRLGDRSRLVRLRPRRKLLGDKRGFVARVRVRAMDPSGNGRTTSRRLRVTR